MKKISILGSTGSIGTQTLEVVRQNPGQFHIEAMTCGRNSELFAKQLSEFRPALAVTQLEEDAVSLRRQFPHIEFLWGEQGLARASAETDTDLCVNALMGMRGLEPTYRAIKAGKDVALANKETLVAGGEVVMEAVRNSRYSGREYAGKPGEAKERRVKILPVDSEHSAIFQCLEGNGGAYCACDEYDENYRRIKKILLTCSGGPFRGYTREMLEKVTLDQALCHPKWSMGKKITVDSATLMNKGLEVIEARWLFNVPADRIQVLVHPQSVVHSGVEFEDNSVLAQLGVPDMRIPISLALGYPERLANPQPELDFFGEGAELTFQRPDMGIFRCLSLAFEAIERGGSCPAVMNAANEVLVEKFLRREIGFTDIQDTLERTLEKHEPVYGLSLEDVIAIDRETREKLR